MSSAGSHDSFDDIEDWDLEPRDRTSTPSGSSTGEGEGAGAEGSAPTGSEEGPAPEEGSAAPAAEPAAEPEPEDRGVEEARRLFDRGVEAARRLFERLRGPSSCPASASSEEPRAAKEEAPGEKEPPRSSPASGGAYPWYAVWDVPGALREIRGIHGGPRAWREIARAIPGGRYRSGTDHLRRSTSELVEPLYLGEASKHGAPCPPPSYWWV